jgi:hypothetical protein
MQSKLEHNNSIPSLSGYLKWETWPIKALYLLPYVVIGITLVKQEPWFTFWIFFSLCMIICILRSIEFINPKIIN